MDTPNLSFDTQEWERVREYLARELLESYDRLSNLTINTDSFRQLQGKIHFIKHMLDFGRSQEAA